MQEHNWPVKAQLIGSVVRVHQVSMKVTKLKVMTFLMLSGCSKNAGPGGTQHHMLSKARGAHLDLHSGGVPEGRHEEYSL